VRGETAIRHGGAPPGAAGPPPAAASARPAVEQIEVAAYYVIAEAFTNAAKHAQASVVDVTVDVADGMLRVRVMPKSLPEVSRQTACGQVPARGLLSRHSARAARRPSVSRNSRIWTQPTSRTGSSSRGQITTGM